MSPVIRDGRTWRDVRAIAIREQPPFHVRLAPDGRIISLNDTFERFFGRSEDEIQGANLLSWMSPLDMQRLLAQATALSPSRPVFEFDIQLEDADGEVHWYEWSVQGRFGADGVLEELDTVGRDITDKLIMQRRIEASERRYRAVVEDQSELIVRYAPDGVITFMNQALCRFLGRSVEEVIGASVLSFVQESVRPKIQYGLSLLDVNPPVVTRLYQITDASGQLRWTEWCQRALRDEDDTLVEVQSVGRDVTDRMAGEEERARLEAELLQVHKMEAIGQLAGGVAHDFNNLLTGITGNVSLLLMDLDTADPMRAPLEEVMEVADQAATVTRQLLSFSRRQVIARELVDVDALLRRFEPMLSRLLGERVALEIAGEGDAPRIYVDPTQLQQVILNLAVNGRDAMPDGGALRIETSAILLDQRYRRRHPYVEVGPYLRLAVIDHGLGMDEETQQRVFEPFFTTKDKERGTGLGLASVYGAIKQNEGSIELTSRPGEGTTVELFLPAWQGAEDPPKATPARPDEVPGGDELLLVVEDAPVVRKLAVLALRRAGYRVLEAAHGQEALKLAAELEEPPRLLITDIIMPGLYGTQLAEALQERWPELKVLYSSGYPDQELVSRDLDDEHASFLGKPYTPKELCARVRSLLDR